MELDVSIGTDPEFFILDLNGNPISAIPLFAGTKYMPEKTKHGTIIHDNVLVEINPKPATSTNQFITNVKHMLEQIKVRLPNGALISSKPAITFPEEQLTHPEAQEFGCEHDFDAWTVSINKIVDTAKTTSLRTAGGHIHVGEYRCPDINNILTDFCNQIDTVKIMDTTAGCISVLLDTDESSVTRRMLYGRAGSHRPKSLNEGDPYNGIEYRTLSSFWLSTIELFTLFSLIANHAILLAKNKLKEMLEFSKSFDIVNTINNSNVIEAENIVNTLSKNQLLTDEIMKHFELLYNKPYSRDIFSNWKM